MHLRPRTTYLYIGTRRQLLSMLNLISLNSTDGIAYLRRELVLPNLTMYYDAALLAAWRKRERSGGLQLTDLTSPNLLVVVASDLVVGTVSFKQPDLELGSVEIGYGVAPPYRRLGYGTIGVKLALAHLMEVCPAFKSVSAYVGQNNLASRRVLVRNDFHITQRINDLGLLTYQRRLRG